MTRGLTWLRLSALLSAGTLAVHELRYLAAYGRESEQALSEQGHAYLNFLGPLIGVLVAAGVAQLMLAAARGRLSAPARSPGFRGRWLAISGALFGIFAAQELAEGTLAAGHASGAAAVLDNGGWLAIVFALAIGALLAWLLREVPSTAAAATGTLRAPRPRGADAGLVTLAAPIVPSLRAPELRPCAARGPPAVSV